MKNIEVGEKEIEEDIKFAISNHIFPELNDAVCFLNKIKDDIKKKHGI